MAINYNEIAQQLAKGKREKMRVIRRRKAVGKLTSGVLIIAMTVGLTYMALITDNKEFEASSRANAEYVQENYVLNISDEEKAQAERDYYEDPYSAQTIDNLKKSIISEYGVLIYAIVENETLKVTSDVPALSEERLDMAISNYGTFKANCEKDKVNYADASGKDRISKAMSLYNTNRAVLEAQLIELNQKSKYLAKDSNEYIENQKAIEDINKHINYIKSDLDIVSERSITIYFEEKNEQEGKQK